MDDSELFLWPTYCVRNGVAFSPAWGLSVQTKHADQEHSRLVQ